VIKFSFKQSAIADIIATALPLLFGIYLVTQKDFNTKFPKIAGMKPQLIILMIAIIGLTIYKYVK
jgi:hypothetical protein